MSTPRRSPCTLRSLSLAALTAVAALATLTLAATSAQADETVLVEAGHAMTWRANSSDPGLGTTWTAEAFTPTGWSAGSYGVGYETGSGATALLATTVPSASNSVYTRTTFEIADVSDVSSVLLGADYDDGYAAWINGVEVYRSPQMPAGAPAWNSAASLHESSNASSPDYGGLVDVSPAALGAIHDGTNVLAVGVWNATLPSSDLVLVPRLSVLSGTSVVRGPYLQLGTPDSVVVRWRTNVAGDSCVRYGASPASLNQSACSAASTTEHVVEVDGLAAGTTYYYSVGSSTETLAGATSDHAFTTSPPAGQSSPARVWVLGDSGTANVDARDVRDAYLAATGSAQTSLWLMLGDNAYNDGTDAEYQDAVFDTYPTMLRQSVLWPTLGNHDGYTADSATQSGPYYDIFTLPTGGEAGGLASGTEAYYSFDYGDIHFVCLDSYETDRSMGSAMLSWLEADLADTDATWIVAFFHHPPYSKGSHDSDTEGRMIDMRENALPVLEEGGVDLVLSGHSHSYERSFLIDGHYEVSTTFSSAMQVDAGSGREDETGAYQKSGGGPVANEGAVYVVAGSSGKVSSAVLDHPAMFISFARLGSLVLDFDGGRLDVEFLDETGVQRDRFTMVKDVGGSCGDGVCDGGETCASCADDCAGAGSACGNGVCEAGDGENCLTCPTDCNGVQNGKPGNRFCCGAAGGTGDIGCSPSQCGTCTTSPASTCCGDGLCSGAENTTTCPRDCGAPPVCGDGTCNGTETSCSCAGDCGAPPVTETSCNDGIDNDCDGLTDCGDTAQCAASPACGSCSSAGAPCSSNSECCSDQCRGKRGERTCR